MGNSITSAGQANARFANDPLCELDAASRPRFTVVSALGGTRATSSLLCVERLPQQLSRPDLSHQHQPQSNQSMGASPIPNQPGALPTQLPPTSDISRHVVVKVHVKPNASSSSSSSSPQSLEAQRRALDEVNQRLAAAQHPALCGYHVRMLVDNARRCSPSNFVTTVLASGDSPFVGIFPLDIFSRYAAFTDSDLIQPTSLCLSLFDSSCTSRRAPPTSRARTLPRPRSTASPHARFRAASSGAGWPTRRFARSRPRTRPACVTVRVSDFYCWPN